MATNKLKPKFCESAPKGNHFDGDGLYLLVAPDLKRYWRMACYLNGKRKLLAFGRFPKVSLAQAREERRKAQVLIKQGIDPVQEARQKKEEIKQAERQQAVDAGNTFEQITRRLHACKQGKTTEEYRDKMFRMLEIHMFPAIGHKTLKEIEGKELLALFRKVAQRSNHGRPMTYMAKKLCQWTAEVYDLAHVEDASFSINPCRAIIKHLPDHDTQHMARIRFQELPKFLQALEQYRGHPVTKAAIWTLLYTGMRQASVRRAVWGDFDLDNAIWHRRPEKADKEAHDLPLPTQAVELLHSRRLLTGQGENDLVFPSVRSNFYPMSEAAVCQAIERMGFPMVGHGLRGVVSTGLNELGYNPRLVEVQLGHKKTDAIEAAYNDAKHFVDRKKMMQTWADYLEQAASQNLVVSMKKQAQEVA
ncbi:MAG: tyrosine-type recombinase/integrase [Burkholderiales bacterium]|jgi:integrase|nr:tyrosine-type recombinase/integrase [Burkholderiales bacterium]